FLPRFPRTNAATRAYAGQDEHVRCNATPNVPATEVDELIGAGQRRRTAGGEPALDEGAQQLDDEPLQEILAHLVLRRVNGPDVPRKARRALGRPRTHRAHSTRRLTGTRRARTVSAERPGSSARQGGGAAFRSGGRHPHSNTSRLTRRLEFLTQGGRVQAA